MCHPEEVVLGRASSNQIVIRDQQASRHHAKVVWYESGWKLCDLGSVNGTYLNGKRIASDELLNDDDVIQIGGCEITFSRKIPGLSHAARDAVDVSQASEDQMTIEMDSGIITDRRRHSTYLEGEISQLAQSRRTPRSDVALGQESKHSSGVSEAPHRLLQ